MRLCGSERIAKLMDRMELEAGEVMQHSMITKSIQRYRRKAEEDNFGVRKWLLEYDDVITAQGEVVYRSRRNALMEECWELHNLNIIYDLAADLIEMAQSTEDLENSRMNIYSSLGI